MGLDVHNGLRCSKSNAPTVSCSFLTEGKNQSQRVHSITSSAANTINELLPPSGLLGASGQGSCGYASDGQGCSLASRSLRSSGSVISETPANRPILCRTDAGSVYYQPNKGSRFEAKLRRLHPECRCRCCGPCGCLGRINEVPAYWDSDTKIAAGRC